MVKDNGSQKSRRGKSFIGGKELDGGRPLNFDFTSLDDSSGHGAEGPEGGRSENLLVDQAPPLPREIVLFPIKEKPVFPGMFLPFTFPANRFEAIFKEIIEQRYHYLGMALEKNSEDLVDSARIIDFEDRTLYRVGTLGRVINVLNTQDQRIQVIMQFTHRFRIEEFHKKDPVFIARIEPIEEITEDGMDSRKQRDTLKGYLAALMSKVKELIELNSIFSEELKNLVSRYTSQSLPKFLNLLSSLLTVPKPSEAQRLLEENHLTDKLLSILDFLHREVEVFRVKAKINQQIEEKVSGQQRDFFLREQLKHIQEELGLRSDEKALAIDKIEKKIASLPLSEEALQAANSELEKLKLYDAKSGEFGVAKNYLDWILSLPWESDDRHHWEVDLDRARKILNGHHYGLEGIKEKLLEFLAVEKLKGKSSGTILCFIGPPGVGKTSLGKSLAEAMGRKFFRFSVGGMRDEAEIKGHRRTYVGAMPGKIIQALKTVGSSAPVIMIDEIDKLGSGHQGDPASALLEVLDPEQNRDFLDHYLDIRFDLSRILFITTANQLETIPHPLRDRMEIIFLSSYDLDEKKNIAKKFLIPRQRKESGLQAGDFSFSPEALGDLIAGYTVEAGVRGLERAIRSLLRKIAYRKASQPQSFAKVMITPSFIEENLEESRIKEGLVHTRSIPGVVCGLAWTPSGGSILYIEAIVAAEQDSPGFKLTGQLGGVMEESAQLAYNYVRSLGIENKVFRKRASGEGAGDFFSRRLVHLHVPAGAISKDGPSAGISMALALASLALGQGVKPHFAMTGELTLSGRVLPIGGIKEKLIAAKKNRKVRVLVPRDNQDDVKKINSRYIKGLTIHYVGHFSEVLDITLAIKIK